MSDVRRGRVSRGPEFSQYRWGQLAVAAADAPPLRELRNVTPAELAQHPTYLVLRESVYDVAAYLPYHPGGDSILASFGTESGDALFDEVHPWVNAKFLLGSCLVGPLLANETESAAAEAEEGS